MFILLQTVKRRNYFLNIFSAYMSIDFGSSTAFMPQQFLNVSEIGSSFQKMSCKTILTNCRSKLQIYSL